MAQAIAFLIKDVDEPEMAGILIQTEREMDFDDIKRDVERVVNDDDLRDKFYCGMASDQTTYSFVVVEGVSMPVFTFHNVTRRDWARDAADVIAKNAVGYSVILFTPEALAITVKNTMDLMGLGDVCGPLRGIPYKEM